MPFRSRQNEYCVMRRFLKRLEKGIESCGSEHVYLVNDKDFVLADGRGYANLFYQIAYIVNRVVGGRIKLMNII
jgi:hypothetical protein